MTANATIPVIVGHQDTLLHLYLPELGRGRDFFVRSEAGHIDLPRAQEGGVAGGFFAVFVPPDPSIPPHPEPALKISATGYTVRLPDPLEHTYALRVAQGVVALLFRLEDR